MNQYIRTGNESDLEYNDCPVCPHCGDEWDTPWDLMDEHMGDGDEMEYECGTCGGSVVATVHLTLRFTTRV